MLAHEELHGGSYMVRGMTSVWWELGRASAQEIAGRWGSVQMRGENGIRMDKGLQNGDRDGGAGMKEVKGGWSGGTW